MSLLQAGSREVRYWGSTDPSEESSAETDQLQDSLEEKTLATRELSDVSKQVEEDSPEIMTHSVSEEIKRFQGEINKVAVENVKYLTWKQQRTGAKQTREIQGNVKYTEKDLDKFQPLQLPPQGKCVLQESIIAPELPPKRKNNKKVTYAENEVTVFTFTEEAPNSLTVIPEVTNNRSLSRQIQPSMHIAPADPPIADSDDLIVILKDDTKGDAEEDVPVLPSVKKLANKFQVNKVDDPDPVIINKKGDNIHQIELSNLFYLSLQEPSVRVPAMLKVKKPDGGYPQVTFAFSPFIVLDILIRVR
jgi:hypothetical protein